MGVGAFPFLGVKKRDTGTGSMVQRGRGASYRPALHSNVHYIGPTRHYCHDNHGPIELAHSVAIGEGVGTADQGLSLPGKVIEPQGHFHHC